MPRWLPILLSLTACAPPPHFAPRAAAARDACGIDDLVPVGQEWVPLALDAACAGHLAADLRVDLEQLHALDGVDPLEAQRGTRGGGLLRVAWLALGADLGPAEDLGLDLPTGEPTAGGAVYDYVVGVVTETRGGTQPDLWARLELRHRWLEIHQPLSGVFGLSVLLHEARHGEVGEGHVPCGFDPSLACDTEPDGPYAWQAALLRVGAEAATDPDVARELRDKAERFGNREP